MIKIEYFVLACADGGYLRFDKGNGQDIVAQQGPLPDGPWTSRTTIPAPAKGWVGHNLALLHLAGLLFGQHGGYVKGTEDDVRRLRDLLGAL